MINSKNKYFDQHYQKKESGFSDVQKTGCICMAGLIKRTEEIKTVNCLQYADGITIPPELIKIFNKRINYKCMHGELTLYQMIIADIENFLLQYREMSYRTAIMRDNDFTHCGSLECLQNNFSFAFFKLKVLLCDKETTLNFLSFSYLAKIPQAQLYLKDFIDRLLNEIKEFDKYAYTLLYESYIKKVPVSRQTFEGKTRMLGIMIDNEMVASEASIYRSRARALDLICEYLYGRINENVGKIPVKIETKGSL